MANLSVEEIDALYRNGSIDRDQYARMMQGAMKTKPGRAIGDWVKGKRDLKGRLRKP